MWGVLALVRHGLQRRPRRQRAARVADESALGDGAGDVAVAPPREREPGTAPAGALLARALLAMACGAVRLDGEDGAGGSSGAEEEAWAASGWRPARAADEVGHLMVRESMRYAIYA
ncbi:unnamed protein product [Urochloa decumbens]|uniref:Uncharacterized protein n=1 Tax=Urochloa decumbens TaxID=240449 RepID=A0ABC9CWL9_9POAL